ncbi:hydrogenase expression protein [Pelistega indica]|uniref:Hydrogenase expression protein n=1 Tax=Pelistega indica TaxID=1414851 RepID=V8FU64_9BURK|nr:ABC transporter ATP-binding protein [Pelistega indica]ETD66947.1 hydrogenase expression protein [Pelistega indica]
MQAPGIIIKSLHFDYDQSPLFTGVSAHFQAGQWHSILGSSGVGKSSLIKIMAGLLSHQTWQGEVMADDGLPLFSRIAWMAQDDLLMPWLSVLENICLGFQLRGDLTPDVQESAMRLLKQVGLSGLGDRKPYQLSGGQRQRVALARTLLEDKPIVLMDEPFSALDFATRLQLQTLFIKLFRDKTVILITHDPLEALRLSQHIWVMQAQNQQPASLVHMVNLSSDTPRSIDDPDVLKWQGVLLNQLSTV